MNLEAAASSGARASMTCSTGTRGVALGKSEADMRCLDGRSTVLRREGFRVCGLVGGLETRMARLLRVDMRCVSVEGGV